MPAHTDAEKAKRREEGLSEEEIAIQAIRERQALAKAAQQAKGAGGRTRKTRAESDLDRSRVARQTRTDAAAKRAAAERRVAEAAAQAKRDIQTDTSKRRQTIDRLIEGQTTDSNNE